MSRLFKILNLYLIHLAGHLKNLLTSNSSYEHRRAFLVFPVEPSGSQPSLRFENTVVERKFV